MDNYICFVVVVASFFNLRGRVGRSPKRHALVSKSERFLLLDLSQLFFRTGFPALLTGFDLAFRLLSAVQKAVGLVAGFNDVAVMGQSIQQRRGHFGVAKHARPLGERQIRGDQNAGVLVEL